MKSSKLITTLLVAPLFAVALAFAAEQKVEHKPAGCCTKAEKAGNKCTHECCVTAAKTGDNCTKCKGSGKIAQNPKPAK